MRTASVATLTSHGRGVRALVLARILASPSVPGSTCSAAADSACRRASARSSSGAVIPPARLPAVSCSLLLQYRLERGYATCRMALHRAPADAHRRRDVGLRQVSVVPQHNCLALAVWQLAQGGDDRGALQQ